MDAQQKKARGAYHHGNLRQGLVALAIERLNAGVRPEDLSIRVMAMELGVSQGAPYRHFPTLESFLAEIAVQGFLALIADLENARSRSQPGHEHLEELGYAYVKLAANRPQLYRTMFSLPAQRLGEFPELARLAGQSYEMLQAAVTEVQSAHPNGGLGPRLGTIAAWAYVHGLAELSIRSLASVPLTEADLRQLTRGLTRGV